MWTRHSPVFAPEGAAAGDGGAGAQAAAAAGAGNGGAAAAAAAAPWHQGLDAETIGLLQNRGVKLDDPKEAVGNLGKAYREATSKLGVPPDQLIRLPRADAPEAEIKSFWQRLGAPADAKEYDFGEVKYADGEALDAGDAETLRALFSRVNLPKSVAHEIVKGIIKMADDDESRETTSRATAAETEKAALQKEWGGTAERYDANLFIAKQGAKALGLTPEQVNALESVTGYAAIMKAMHRVGVLNKEDRFVAGGNGSNGLMSREQASARKTELMADKAWTERYMKGDTQARGEMLNLNRIITGDFESAA